MVTATNSKMKKARRIARETFGISKPYKHQKQTWRATIVDEKSAFVVIPTGGGKSLGFQIPCIVRKGLAVVVSPLLALMREQVDRLQSLGIKAVRIGMDMPKADIRRALRKIRNKKAKIVYVAPERLRNPAFEEAITDRKIGTIVCDESHSISFHARDFRPAYKDVGLFRQKHYKAVVIAVTATADDWIEDDVTETLKLYDHKRIVGAPDRPNLTYEAVYDEDPGSIQEWLAQAREEAGEDGPAIVYCASRKHVENTVGRKLRQGSDLSVGMYHAGFDSYTRQKVQDAFMSGDVDVMVATNAFGMGIDKANVRLVYHFDLPESIFAYCQEAGRSGRDGEPSLCVLNIDGSGKRIRNFFFQIQNPSYYVYEHIWAALRRHKKRKTLSFSATTLDRIGGSSLNGTGVSAMRFMEYKHCIRVNSGLLVYKLPIMRRGAALEIVAERNVEYEINGDTNELVISLPPDYRGSVITDLVRERCVLNARPIETHLIERVSDTLAVTERDVEIKKDRASAHLDDIHLFARTADKHGFINEAFLK